MKQAKHTLPKVRMALALLMVLVTSWTKVEAQTSETQNWQLKTNLTGFLSDALNLEAERAIGKHWAITAQGGVIINLLEFQDANNLEGYFVRAGVKRYFFQENREMPHTGFALKGEFHYSYWKDWYTNLRGNFGNRWENSLGAIISASYTQPLGKSLILEPFVGIGYAPVWESTRIPNDIEPFQTFVTDWRKVRTLDRRFNYFSHFTLVGDVVFNAGLSLGLRFPTARMQMGR